MIVVTLEVNMKVPVDTNPFERKVKYAGTEYIGKTKKDLPEWLQAEIALGRPTVSVKEVDDPKEETTDVVDDTPEDDTPEPAPAKKKPAKKAAKKRKPIKPRE